MGIDRANRVAAVRSSQWTKAYLSTAFAKSHIFVYSFSILHCFIRNFYDDAQ
jgi:hypothetical protein